MEIDYLDVVLVFGHLLVSTPCMVCIYLNIGKIHEAQVQNVYRMGILGSKQTATENLNEINETNFSLQ